MNIQEVKQTARQMIAKNHILSAIELTMDFIKFSERIELSDELIVISCQYNDLSGERRQGKIGYEVYKRESTILIYQLLKIITAL